MVSEVLVVLSGKKPSVGESTRENDRVRFAIASIFLPSSEEVTRLMPGVQTLEGTIVGFSDSGERPRAFAVIEVLQRHTFVVPVERLQPAEGV